MSAKEPPQKGKSHLHRWRKEDCILNHESYKKEGMSVLAYPPFLFSEFLHSLFYECLLAVDDIDTPRQFPIYHFPIDHLAAEVVDGFPAFGEGRGEAPYGIC